MATILMMLKWMLTWRRITPLITHQITWLGAFGYKCQKQQQHSMITTLVFLLAIKKDTLAVLQLEQDRLHTTDHSLDYTLH